MGLFFEGKRFVYNIGQRQGKEKGVEGVGEARITDGVRSHSKKRGNHEHGGETELGCEGGLIP